ncbi:hypothetical protein [Leptospira sp. GIMC2001]|uniref:hypothetical protein n=1 Tax=Leptospira sp. GIMC2001 TaxID=1513297 RepID=UPI0023492631|nr:hypothetical protein [Leptospira sp. GIMC2001]WCL48365.1 hypothetical protein O4O04_13750 [Leptospira sp. GIMC2001]
MRNVIKLSRLHGKKIFAIRDIFSINQILLLVKFNSNTKSRSILVYLQTLILISIFISSPIFSERIVTQKDEEPDDYYGLKIGGVITPSFGYRTRDASSGYSDTSPNDQTGFSLPWTLLTINKEWEELGLEAELWTEVIRSSSFSNDTVTNQGNKADPYTLGIRRGNIKKKYNAFGFNQKIIFGIQEMPSTFTQWNGSWDWRYMDRSPTESLGFFNAPADLGLSWIGEISILNLQLGLANGEGYRSVQNVESSGVDGYARISVSPTIEDWKFGLHAIARSKNLVGLAGNECLERRSNCMVDDNNPNTFLEKDLRSRKGETAGFELTVDHNQYLHFGAGYIWRRDYEGSVRDRLNSTSPVIYNRDRFGHAIYSWLGFGFNDFWIVFRGEKGTGRNGILNANFSDKDEVSYRLNNPNDFNPENIYSSKEEFIKRSIIVEYRIAENFRFGLGGSITTNFNPRGERERIYIDPIGETRSQNEYESQFTRNTNLGIVSYSKREERLFIRASFIF